MSWERQESAVTLVLAAQDDKRKGWITMPSEIEKQVAELKEKIRKANIMISYHWKKLNQYKDERQKLREELDAMRDDFWEDDG